MNRLKSIPGAKKIRMYVLLGILIGTLGIPCETFAGERNAQRIHTEGIITITCKVKEPAEPVVVPVGRTGIPAGKEGDKGGAGPQTGESPCTGWGIILISCDMLLLLYAGKERKEAEHENRSTE